MSSKDREAMDAALKELVIPVLRANGFKGSLPHFRRVTPQAIDLLTFQFDKWGGGFVVEISKCSPGGDTMHSGGHNAPSKNNAPHPHTHPPKRIPTRPSSGNHSWVRLARLVPTAT